MSVILCMSGPITVGASTGSLGEDIIGTTTGGITVQAGERFAQNVRKQSVWKN